MSPIFPSFCFQLFLTFSICVQMCTSWITASTTSDINWDGFTLFFYVIQRAGFKDRLPTFPDDVKAFILVMVAVRVSRAETWLQKSPSNLPTGTVVMIILWFWLKVVPCGLILAVNKFESCTSRCLSPICIGKGTCMLLDTSFLFWWQRYGRTTPPPWWGFTAGVWKQTRSCRHFWSNLSMCRSFP